MIAASARVRIGADCGVVRQGRHVRKRTLRFLLLLLLLLLLHDELGLASAAVAELGLAREQATRALYVRHVSSTLEAKHEEQMF